jgi:hypothetical protein
MTGSATVKRHRNLWLMLAAVFSAGALATITGQRAARGVASTHGGAASQSEQYPYGSESFNQFITDSYGRSRADAPGHFYRWMARAYTRSGAWPAPGQRAALPDAVQTRRKQLAAVTDATHRSRAELRTAVWVHHFVKSSIPRFSLDRGFEFRNVVNGGERQCFLQSVLIAGLLQQMGIQAGVVMVNRSMHGAESNNGHAVTLVKLRDGRDVLVDASEALPLARHQGLFVAASGYRYVEPLYDGRNPTIIGYRPAGGTGTMPPSAVRTLATDFLRSQFYYYRGERAVGGPLSRRPTTAGLEAATGQFRVALKHCPENPLPVYMLGYTSLKLRQLEKARRQITAARGLYERFGWVPSGVHASLLHATPVPLASPGAVPPIPVSLPSTAARPARTG